MRIVWPFRPKSDEKKSFLARDKKSLSNELVKYGEDMANANRLDEALESFDKAITINPQNDLAWGDRGLILDKIGKTEEALASYSKALLLDPDNSITWHNKGLTLLQSSRLRESITCFEMAISINQNYAKAWYNKARALSLVGELNSSQKCFDRAKKLDPLLYTKLRKLRKNTK